MARTDRFRIQHNELLALAGELQALLNPQSLAADGAAARNCLGKLMGKLTLHLSTEDKVLYPELASSKDASVANLARRYAEEMKGVTEKLAAYNQRWSTPSAIKAGAEAFVRETKQVLSLLADRMRRENQELYAMADRL